MPDSDYERVDGLLDQVLAARAEIDPAAAARGLGRLRLAVMFAGPWERLEMRLPAGGRLWLRVATWVNRRDVAWVDRHLARGVDPAERWRRRPGVDCGLDAS